MALVPRNTLEHFTHPQHLLTKLEAETEYLCDGCKTIGRGTRFRCIEGCNFDLHDYCAMCPSSLSTFMHAQHTLNLVQAVRHLNRFCDMCLDPVEGLSYRCKGCDFDVHPLCTQLPGKVRHALHTRHHLQLRKWSSGLCAVCGGRCTSWRYGCVTCGFDIHIDCVVAPPAPPGTHRSVPPCGPPPSSSSTERGIPGFGPLCSLWPPQPQPQHYDHGYGYPYALGVGFGVPYYCPNIPYNYNMYNNMFNNHTNYPAQGGAGANGGLGKKMFGIIGQLTIGVLSNVIFGALTN